MDQNKAPGLAAAGANTEQSHSAQHWRDEQPIYGKRLANLQARFALCGFELHPLHGDNLIVARWGMHKVLPSFDAAERFLTQIGGRQCQSTCRGVQEPSRPYV